MVEYLVQYREQGEGWKVADKRRVTAISVDDLVALREDVEVVTDQAQSILDALTDFCAIIDPIMKRAGADEPA